MVGADMWPKATTAIRGGPVTTAAELDPAPKLGEYAHPERLVTTAWLADHLDDPNLVVAESDEDVLLYETGHIPGAVKIDWHLDLNDPVERDYVSGEGFARLMSSKGISRDTTIVFYGDNFNWWAAYALWVSTLFGHPDVRLLDGGQRALEAGRQRGRHLQVGRGAAGHLRGRARPHRR
jgi:thiosulfate/3-mercaptopyruvate sulfurtransferase